MAEFPQTRWTLLEVARSGDADAARQALAELFSAYWLPMCEFVTWKFSLSPDQAEEVVQGFVSDKFVGGKLLAAADRKRGRLRDLLCTALANYAFSAFRGAAARRRLLEQLKDDPTRSIKEPDRFPGPLDVSWAVLAMAETLGRMESECRSSNQENRWGIFHQRVLRPLFTGCEPVSYQRLVDTLNLPDQSVAEDLLVTAKRHFGRTLRKVAATKDGGGPLWDERDPARSICTIMTELLLRHRTVLERVTFQMRELCHARQIRSQKRNASSAAPGVNYEAAERGLNLMGEFFSSAAQIGPYGDVSKLNAPSLSRSPVAGERSRTALLEELLAAAPASENMNEWDVEELAVAFSQQLTAPLPCSLAGLDAHDAAQVREACESRDLLLRSLEELFLHPRPPRELLGLTKDYAKILREAQVEEGTPPPVATAIYFLAIAVALVRCGEMISTLPESELVDGWRWGRDTLWLDERYRRVFQEALDRLSASPEGRHG